MQLRAQARGENATRGERKAHGAEVSARHGAIRRLRTRSARPVRTAFNAKGVSHRVLAQRQILHGAGGDDARQGFNSLQCPLEEGDGLVIFAVFARRKQN